ncbi:MAG: HAMP domain-containing protein [Rubrivivax sp.]|nr:HAMP domain-containing protein [Rubrivivax sp.]
MDPQPRGWRRFDTLGLRLFVLMWVVLVVSHGVAFWLSLPLGLGDLGPPPQPGAGPGAGGPPPGPPPGLPPVRALPPADLPSTVQWVDLLLRAAVIALGAALGARWLARPMRQLSRAADSLSQRLARHEPLPVLDEHQGTAEVRRSAAVFNQMAQRLQAQFDARGLHLAAVSHDLRTPLTRLRMRLEDGPPALAQAAAQDIHEMTEMIDSTLAVLREQRDGSPPGLLQLRAAVAAVVDDLSDSGQAVRTVRAVHLLDGPEHRVCARPAALRRIVGNLVGNALRYGGSATLQLHAMPDGGVALHVDDRGPGIPAERIDDAFRPWVRLTEAHARSGHGLGLAIARDLAERDGGRLTLANRPEGGLRATLWLPRSGSVSAPTHKG